jgi:hypothetical protein
VIMSWPVFFHAVSAALVNADSRVTASIFTSTISSAGGGDGSQTISKGKEVIFGAFFGQSTFATYALVEEANTVKVVNDVALEFLGPLGCGIQTGAGAVINTLHPAAGSSIAIFGAGAVGLSTVMAAAASACPTVIAIDLNADRLKLVIQRELEDPLAVKILGGEFHEGKTIRVERGKGNLEFSALAV